MNANRMQFGLTAQFGQQNLLHGLRERQQKQKEKRAPMEDALQRLTNNALDAKAQNKDAKANKMAIEMDTFVSKLGPGENRALKDLDDEELMFYQHLFMESARLAQGYEDRLLDLRDQLSAFDQTIRDYQDMLDGRREMSKDMTKETVTALLDKMKSAREQFLHDSIGKLGEAQPGYAHGIAGTFSIAVRIIGPDGTRAAGEYAEKPQSFWRVDASAKNIYGEIDRVLGAVQDAGQRFGETLNAISKELARRGYTEDKYQLYFDKLREQFMPRWQREADPAATVRLYMEKAMERDEEE